MVSAGLDTPGTWCHPVTATILILLEMAGDGRNSGDNDREAVTVYRMK